MKWFGRDPVWYTNLFAVLIMAVASFGFHLTADQQGGLNAVALAIAGVIIAVQLRSDGQLAFAVQLMKALIALGLSFGLHLSPDQQFVLVSIVTAVGSGFLRTQVIAPVPKTVDSQLVGERKLGL
jgi:nitrate/nitrite transporter NarK